MSANTHHAYIDDTGNRSIFISIQFQHSTNLLTFHAAVSLRQHVSWLENILDHVDMRLSR